MIGNPIAQIFRKRNVDISTQHLMRAIRLFIAEVEGTRSKGALQEWRQGPGSPREEKKISVTYQPSAYVSPLVREGDFAKQLRLARYLAASSLPPARPLEPRLKARTPKQVRPLAKARRRTKAASRGQKTGDAELAKERRRAQQLGRHKVSTGVSGRSEKQRSSPGP